MKKNNIILINLIFCLCSCSNGSNTNSSIDSVEEQISESIIESSLSEEESSEIISDDSSESITSEESSESSHEHTYNTYEALDSVLHYQICEGCGKKTGFEEHSYDEKHLVENNLKFHYEQECQVCHYTDINPYNDRSKNMENYLGSDGDVYRINITSNDGIFPYSKESYVQGVLSVTEQDTSKVLLPATNMKAKLRGNSTSTAPKKPLKIKFDKKESLFGLKKAKNYVLLANFFDKSNVRNYLAYILANKMSNLDFQPSSIFVDLYYDGVYQGLYLLCEQMEVNEGRVDVKNIKSANGINSFMIEADARAADEYYNYPDAFFRSGGYTFGMKYPDADDFVENYDILYKNAPGDKEEALKFVTQFYKDMDWLKLFMKNVVTSINNGWQYERFIDIKSFIDYYIVEELFKNVDIGSTSQYYYINQSEENPVLHAGPVWDFDIALGVVGTDKYNYYDYVASELWVKDGDYFYKRLLNNSAFVKQVKARYKEIRPVLQSIYEEFDLIKEVLAKAQERDKKRWPVTYMSNTWIELFATTYYYDSLPTLDAHYYHLKKSLDERFEVMDRYYL